jgi:linoleoyl-CoA desaturase
LLAIALLSHPEQLGIWSSLMPTDRGPPPRFAKSGAFQQDLNQRVAEYFARTGLAERDLPAMYLKTATILLWAGASWAWLMWGHPPLGLALLLSVSLGLAVAGIGMGVQHDANHGGYSRHGWVNRAMGWLLDAAGASSYVWRTKHNAIHHTWTNVAGHDDDIEIGVLGRWSPEQPRRAWHRWQHVYTWALYGLLIPKWVFFDDFFNLATGRIGRHRLARPSRGEWWAFLAGKLTFYGWALALPLLWHPIGAVALCFMVMVVTTGVTLGTTFQLAHCVEESSFPTDEAGRLPSDWAEHQLRTTVDFAPDNPVLTWFMGGLNFQVEHHLFPKICHLHYPALAKIVAQTAADHGLAHRSTPSFWRAVGSHVRLLRTLGQPQATAIEAQWAA